MESRKHYTFLDGFRGLLCIWIVLFHFTTRYHELFGYSFGYELGNGKYAVMLFFSISGFLTMFTADKYYKNRWIWLKGKIKRLYPQYILSCIIIFIVLSVFPLPGREVHWYNLLTDFLLFPFVFFHKVEGAHWYVISLIYFYLFFYAIARFRLQAKLCFYVIGCIFFSALIICNLFEIDLFLLKILRTLSLNIFHLGIFMGMLLYMVIHHGGIYKMLFLFLLTLLVWQELNLLLLFLYIFMYIMLQSPNNILNKILSTKMLTYLGNVSYSWYLIHQNIGYLCINSLISLHIATQIIPVLALCFTLFMGIALEKLYTYLNKRITCQK